MHRTTWTFDFNHKTMNAKTLHCYAITVIYLSMESIVNQGGHPHISL